MTRAVTLTLLCGVLAACSDKNREPCDPLSMDEAAVALGEVIAVGRDGDGTLYVLEQPEDGGNQRVFVSDDEGTLWRRRVLGGGESNEGDGRFLLTTFMDDDGSQRSLLVAIDRDGTIRMSLAVASDEDLRRGDPSVDGEPLEVVAKELATDAPLRNLAPEVFIEYLARVEDGRGVLVVRPNEDWDYEDFRLFLGTPQRMLERQVSEVARARDGGSTRIAFELGGGDAELDFPFQGEASLTVEGRTLHVERLEPSANELGDLRFFCR